ncbi:MAG: hypothetical protein U0X91_07195 [Spirosomataceae bacterium]
MNTQFMGITLTRPLILAEVAVLEESLLSLITMKVGSIVSMDFDKGCDKPRFEFDMNPEEVGRIREEIITITDLLSRIAEEKTRLLYLASGLTR